MNQASNRPERTQIMTLREAAKYLGVHPITIYRLIKQTDIPTLKLGGQWRFKKDILDTWLVQHMRRKRNPILKGLIICVFLSAFLMPLPIFAQEQNSLKNKEVTTNNAPGNFAEITLSQGMVQIQSAGSTQWKNASVGTKLYPNDKIRTLIESLAQLKYPDNTTLTLRENSMLTIQDISRDPKSGLTKRELKLNLGGMKYKVTHLEEKGSEFKIHSSTAIVGVTGTEGTITNEGDGQPTKNILTEGSTYNTDENGANGQPLKAGNAWEIDDNSDSDRHMLGDNEKSGQEYKERDAAVQKRFHEFIRNYNQKISQGYDIDPLKEILALLYPAAEANDPAKLNALLEQAEKLIENLIKPTDKEAQDTTFLLQQLIIEIGAKEKEGYDLSKVYLILAKAKNYFKEKMYAETKEAIEQARLALGACEQKAYDFDSRFQQFLNELNLKAKAGFIVEEIVELTKRIQIFVETRERAQAEAHLNKAKAMLALAKRGISEELLKSLEELKLEIAAKKKDGSEVARLEELLLQANKARDQNEYLKLEELIKEIKEKAAHGLNKKMPEELLVLFNKFEEELKKKGGSGYDVGGLQALIHSIYEAREKGNFDQLSKLLAQALDALAKIQAPGQLLNHLQDIQDKIKEKQEAGYVTYELETLIAQIQSSLDKGAISNAQDLLVKLEDLLNALSDNQPPLLQAGDLLYQGNNVVVSGVATDNIKIAWVSVNGNQAELQTNGKFIKELPLIAGLAEIKVEAADTEGNFAPQIIIPIPADKIPAPQDEDKTPPEFEAKDAQLTYIMPDQLKIEGKTEPAAIISINKTDVFTDASGAFSLQITANKELVDSGLALSARDANGNNSPALNIKVEDKWPGQIQINKVELLDNLAPSLKTNDLVYEKDAVLVSGSCIDAADIVVEGTAQDIGSGIKNISINGEAALLEGDTFKSALPLTADLTSLEIIAEDSSGNKASQERAVDFFLKSPQVAVGGNILTLDKDGAFSTRIPLEESLQQIIIEAQDNLGNQAQPVKLVVADRIPPVLSLGDILYTPDSVEINGSTEPRAIVYDKNAKALSDKITADDGGIFKINIKRPQENISLILVAEDLSGNLSAEVNLNINALLDQKPPLLTVANLDYKDDKIIVSGSAEDDTGIESITVNNKEAFLNSNQFSEEVLASADLLKIEVIATDLSGKTTAVVKAVEDTVKPQVNLKELKYEDGYCIVRANASDNLGLKEVRVNNIPAPVKLPEGGDFEYKLAVTADLKEVIIGALDLYGNYTETPAEAITLPPDNTAPVLTLDEITYGSPIAIVSGKVTDNLGVKNVLINNLPVNIYEDGSFKTQIPINFGAPSLSLNEPAYENGLVIISGRLNPGTQDPLEIMAQAEDLNGNKSHALKKAVTPFSKEDLKITVNNNPVDIENDSFSTKLAIEKGMPGIEAEVVDPFGNTSGIVTLALEEVPPVINLDDPVYKENIVTISGTAADSGSGISEVLINDKTVSLREDGKFSQDLSLNESNIIVVAVDKLGNMSTAPPLQLNPPDRSAPVFTIKVSPMPATVGKNVFIGIEALDSKTRMPELLPKPPEVKVTLPGGETRDLTLSGEGASFGGTLETGGLSSGLISISVKGTDQGGNSGDKTEGTAGFLLNTSDNVPPTLNINLAPAPPIAPGAALKITVTSSETLKSLPKAEINLPGGANFPLNLEGPLSGTLFTATAMIPPNLTPGNATLRFSEIIDLAGNIQGASSEISFMILPQAQRSNLPLYIESSQITLDRILIKGSTAAEAIVHLNIADIKADLPADKDGRFNFAREITRIEIEKWARSSGPFLRLDAYAANYAGSNSEKIILNIPLPSYLPFEDQLGNFSIEIQPQPVEQGKAANILVKSRAALTQPPRAIIKLSDNRVETLALSGSGKEFNAVYQTSQLTQPGPAIIEVRSEAFSQTRAFFITPALITTGAGFYVINVNPDPIIVGKEAEISVLAQRPLSALPKLEIRLPGGKTDFIALSGEGKEFKGKYLCPANIQPGPAELIINNGEFRRPCGIAPALNFGQTSKDIFAFSNPMPMLAGTPATITVKSLQNLDFLPKADLRLGNGRFIPVTLSGSVPGSIFNGQLNLPVDAPYGPAFILVKSNKNEFLGEYPTGIAPSMSAMAGAEFEIFMVPYSAGPGQNVMINVTSKRGPISFIPQAKLTFSNGSIFPLRLEGILPAQNFRAPAVIPTTASFGPVAIIVSDNSGKPSIAQAMIGSGTQMTGGDIQINLMPPHPLPGANFEISVFAQNSLYQLPTANLVTEKGAKDIRLDGAVPGNTFRANVIFPKDAKVSGSKIDLRYDAGRGEQTKTIYLEGGHEEETEFRPPQLTPNPPRPGQPLMLKLYAPQAVDFIPLVRLNYVNGQSIPLNMSGPIPGDTFTGTLANVAAYVKSLDIIDPEDNSVIINLPIEMLGGPAGMPQTPRVEFNPPAPLMPGMMTNLILDFPGPVPVMPRVNIQLPDGRNINVFVNGMIPGAHFTGIFNLPSDSASGQANLQVYIADQFVDGIPPVTIGTGMSTTILEIPEFRVYPGACQELILDWYILPNAAKHRIVYEASGIPQKSVDVGRIGHYVLTGLTPNKEYKVSLLALDAKGIERYRSERTSPRVTECGTGAGNAFPLRASRSGDKGAQLNWDPQYGANSYELHYALDADPMAGTALPLGNVTSYLLSNLNDGNYRFLVEAISLSGEHTKSLEAIVSIGMPSSQAAPNLIPNPPVIGQPLEIQFNRPAAIYMYPKVAAQYQTMAPDYASVSGALPGTSFSARIPYVKDKVTFINFYDPVSNDLRHQYPVANSTLPAGGTPQVNISCGPPAVISVANLSPQAQPTYCRIFLATGSYDYLMNGPFSGTAFTFTLNTVLPGAPTSVQILDNGKNPIPNLSAQPWPCSGPAVVIGEPTPNNPPLANTEANFPVIFSAVPTYAFTVTATFNNGTTKTLTVTGSGMNYSAKLLSADWPAVAVTQVTIVVKDSTSQETKVSRPFSVGSAASGANTFTVNPDPPVIGQNAYVTLQTAAAQVAQPYVKFLFTDGTYWNVLMFGNAGGASFNFTYTTLYKSLNAIEFWDNGQANKLAERIFGSSSSANAYFIKVYTNGPTQEYPIVVTTPNSLASCWQLATSPDNPGMAAFSVTATNTCAGTNNNIAIPALAYTITKIELWDNTKSTLLATKNFNQPSNCWQLSVSPDPPQLALACAVTLTNTCGISLTLTPAHIRVYFEGGITRDYIMSGSGTSFNYALTATDMNRFVNKIQVFDDNWGLMVEKVFSSGTMGYPINLWDEAAGTSTERRIHWDTVAGAPGYDIYVGLNNPPSTIWKEVTGGNINTEIVSGLTIGQTYWYHVTVDGYTQHAEPKSFTAGGGGGGAGKIKINSPSADPDGTIMCDFNDTNPGNTTNSISITIQNIGSTSINLKKKAAPLTNLNNFSSVIALGNINFPDTLTIPVGSTINQNISINIPAGTASGDYANRTEELMELYDDENGNGTKDTNESSVKLRLLVYVGTFVTGIDIAEPGANFTAYSGANSSSATVHVQNTKGAVLPYIRTSLTPIVRVNGSETIPTANAHFSLNSSVANALGPGETTFSSFYISVPANQAIGTYQGILTIYNDDDLDGTLDTGIEPYEILPFTLTVTAPPGNVTGLTAVNAYTGGTVNLSWDSMGAGYHYHVYYSTTSGGQNFASPIVSTSNSIPITGLTNGTLYYFIVRSSSGASHTPGDSDLDSNTNEVSAMPTLSVPTTVYGASAANRGTGGTIDLTWGDTASDNHYHIYYGAASGTSSPPQSFQFTSNKNRQFTGLTNGATYYFLVRNSPGASHTNGDGESVNTVNVSATPSAAAGAPPPTFSGIKRAYANGTNQTVVVEFDPATDQDTPISYNIYCSTSLSALFNAPVATVAGSPAPINTLTNGTLYYFAVRAKDSFNNMENNSVVDSATPYGNVTHINISGATSSTTGTPVLVKLTAYDGGTVNTTFSDAVKVQIIESPSSGEQKYFLSVQDRVTGDTAEIPMSSGVGYFTIDTFVPETVTIKLPSGGLSYQPGGGLPITFTSAAWTTGASVSQFALEYDRTALTGNNGGALIHCFALDNTGKTITDYTGTITFLINDPGAASITLTKEKGAGALVGNQYTYTASDNGEVIFRLKDTATETVTFQVTAPFASNTASIDFAGVTQFLLVAAGQSHINANTIGKTIQYYAYAASPTGVKLGGYNGVADVWQRQAGTDSNNSARIIPLPIQFSDGKAEFELEDSEYETVTFYIRDSAGGIQSADTSATFASSDSTPPDIREVVAETPFLIHIYFTEDIDSTNALITANYTGVGSINKVCWYGNEVTLHLASPLSPGSNASVTVEGDSPNGIKDKTANNYMGDKTKGFSVPNVNYQGSSYGSGDWLEINVSPSTISYTGNQTVKVIIHHKNACGYLTGSNAVNKTVGVTTVNLTYNGTGGGSTSSAPSSVSMSDGKCEFDITTYFTSPGQTVTISANASGVTSGTAIITSQ